LKDPVERLSPYFGHQVGVECSHKELSVNYLVFAFFFETILFFDLIGLNFNLSGWSFCTYPMMNENEPSLFSRYCR
jgi:hypothetical protein